MAAPELRPLDRYPAPWRVECRINPCAWALIAANNRTIAEFDSEPEAKIAAELATQTHEITELLVIMAMHRSLPMCIRNRAAKVAATAGIQSLRTSDMNTFQYPNVPAETITTMVAKLQQGGIDVQPIEMFAWRMQGQGITADVLYAPATLTLTVTVVDKPFLVPYRVIDSKIKAALGIP